MPGIGPNLGAMARSIWKRYRWDRIGLVTGTFSLMVIGLVAWVSPDAPPSEGSSAAVLSHPDAPPSVEPAGALPTSRRVEPQPQPEAEPAPKPPANIKPCSCNKSALKIPRNPYTAHRVAARNLPNSFFVKDKSGLDWGRKAGKLVPVEDGRGYHIAPLSHSHKALLPEARNVLHAIGNAFADELKGTPSEGALIRISSMTRTAAQQKALGQRNYNAIGEESTHSYGASFDIAFTDRPSNDVTCSDATRAIQKVLLDFQRRGEILVVPEGTCMHVTVRP